MGKKGMRKSNSMGKPTELRRQLDRHKELGGDCDLKGDAKEEYDLEESIEEFRSLFERSAGPMLLLDGDTFIECNEAALRVLGYATKDQVVGLHLFDISPETQPDGRRSSEKARQIIDIALNEGRNRLQWVHRDAQGRDFWVDVSLTAMPLLGKRPLLMVWRDVGEHKRALKAPRPAKG